MTTKQPKSTTRKRRPTPAKEFVERVASSFEAKRAALPIPPASTTFPLEWEHYCTRIGRLTLRGATAPDAHALHDWFVSREKEKQGCGSLSRWAGEIATKYIETIRLHYGDRYTSVLFGWTKVGDLVLAVMPDDSHLYMDAFCVVVPASSVPAKCETCQTNAAWAMVNVRVPERTSRKPARAN